MLYFDELLRLQGGPRRMGTMGTLVRQILKIDPSERKKAARQSRAAFCIQQHQKEEQLTQSITVLQTWQRPTLPRLETEYHRRWGVSRPSSEWDRVQPPRHSHQVSETVKDFWSSRIPTPIRRHFHRYRAKGASPQVQAGTSTALPERQAR